MAELWLTLLPGAHTSRTDERNGELPASHGLENEVSDIHLSGVAGALEAVEGDRVHSHSLGGLCVPGGDALVDDLDSVLLELLHELGGRAAGSFDNLDSGVDDDVLERGVVDRREHGKNGEVNAYGALAARLEEALSLVDLGGESLRSRLGESGDEAEAAGVGDGGGEASEADVMHTPLDHRVLDVEHLGDGSGDGHDE